MSEQRLQAPVRNCPSGEYCWLHVCSVHNPALEGHVPEGCARERNANEAVRHRDPREPPWVEEFRNELRAFREMLEKFQ